MRRYPWLALVGIAIFQPGCGGGTTTTVSALCSNPCFAWQYCDPGTRTCLGTLCYRRPVPMPTPAKGSTPPDVAECGGLASCDFTAGGTDALGNAYGRCQVIPCVVGSSDCDDGVFCNGAETCSGATKDNPRGCAAGAPPCSVSMACVEATRGCTCTGAGDADGDGHVSIDCGGDDCDDTDANAYPGNPEVCDSLGHDEDCDPTTYGPRSVPGGSPNGGDKDGDGFTDVACCQKQASGELRCGSDCDDTRATVNPAAVEACNGVDDNCNGMTDEGVTIAAYADLDHDGYGAVGSSPVEMCPQDLSMGTGFSIYANDCDDTNPAIVPGTVICQPNPTQATAWPVSICSSTGVWTASTCQKGLTCTTQPNQIGVCI